MYGYRLPVLAGGAGALGATYCPPYVLDGASYNPQLTGSPFIASSSKLVKVLPYSFVMKCLNTVRSSDAF